MSDIKSVTCEECGVDTIAPALNAHDGKVICAGCYYKQMQNKPSELQQLRADLQAANEQAENAEKKLHSAGGALDEAIKTNKYLEKQLDQAEAQCSVYREALEEAWIYREDKNHGDIWAHKIIKALSQPAGAALLDRVRGMEKALELACDEIKGRTEQSCDDCVLGFGGCGELDCVPAIVNYFLQKAGGSHD